MYESKQKIIDSIVEMNRSAGAEFLGDFTEAELQKYLDHLQGVWDDFQRQFQVSPEEFDAGNRDNYAREHVLVA